MTLSFPHVRVRTVGLARAASVDHTDHGSRVHGVNPSTGARERGTKLNLATQPRLRAGKSQEAYFPVFMDPLGWAFSTLSNSEKLVSLWLHPCDCSRRATRLPCRPSAAHGACAPHRCQDRCGRGACAAHGGPGDQSSSRAREKPRPKPRPPPKQTLREHRRSRRCGCRGINTKTRRGGGSSVGGSPHHPRSSSSAAAAAAAAAAPLQLLAARQQRQL